MMLEEYDPVIVFNDKISTVNDKIQLETTQAREFLNDLFTQPQKGAYTRKKYCEVCLARHVSFEGHHFCGIKHDSRQITVCIPCHNILTQRQTLWDSRWWNNIELEYLKLSFLYRGIYDVLQLIAERRQNSLYSDIAKSIIPVISFLQNGSGN